MLEDLGENDRYWERREILDEEQNITDFQVVEDVKSCAVDFYQKPYAEGEDIEVQ